jgi:CRP-like cAMP-binding protein
MTAENLANVLADHDFFSGLRSDHIEALVEIATDMEIPTGDVIFEEGGRADSAYAIVDGSVALELSLPHRGQHILQTLHRGEMLGWSWLFPPHRWSFGALAIEPSQLVRFEADQLRALHEEDCEFGYELMKRFAKVMTNRLRATRLQLVDFYGHTY